MFDNSVGKKKSCMVQARTSGTVMSRVNASGSRIASGRMR